MAKSHDYTKERFQRALSAKQVSAQLAVHTKAVSDAATASSQGATLHVVTNTPTN